MPDETPAPPAQTREAATARASSSPPAADVDRLTPRGLVTRFQEGFEKFFGVPEFVSGHPPETRSLPGEYRQRARFVAQVDAAAQKSLELLAYFRQQPENLSRFINEKLVGASGEIPRKNMVAGFTALSVWRRELELDIADSRGRQREITDAMANAQERLSAIEHSRTPAEEGQRTAWQDANYFVHSLARKQEQDLAQRPPVGRAHRKLTRDYLDEEVIPELDGKRDREELARLRPIAHPASVETYAQYIDAEIKDREEEYAPLISKYRREGERGVDQAKVDQTLAKEFSVHEAKEKLDAQFGRAIERASAGRLVGEAREIFEQEFARHRAIAEEFVKSFNTTRTQLSAGGAITKYADIVAAMPKDLVEQYNTSTAEYKEIAEALKLNRPYRDLGNPAEYNLLLADLGKISGNAVWLDVNRRGSTIAILRRIREREEANLFQNDEQRQAYAQRKQELEAQYTTRRELSDREIAQKIGGRYLELWQKREALQQLQEIYQRSGLSASELERFRELIHLANATPAGLPPNSPEAKQYQALEQRLRGSLGRMGRSLAMLNQMETEFEGFIVRERQRIEQIVAAKERPEYQELVAKLNSPAIRQAIASGKPLEQVPEFVALQEQIQNYLTDLETDEEKDLRVLQEKYDAEESKIQVNRGMQEVVEPILETLETKIAREYGQGFLVALNRRREILEQRVEQHKALQAALHGESPGASQVAEQAKRGLEFSEKLANSYLEEIVQMLMSQFKMPEEQARRTARRIRNRLSLWNILMQEIFPALQQLGVSARSR